MKRSKFSEAQIAFVLKQAEDGTSIGEVGHPTGCADCGAKTATIGRSKRWATHRSISVGSSWRRG